MRVGGVKPSELIWIAKPADRRLPASAPHKERHFGRVSAGVAAHHLLGAEQRWFRIRAHCDTAAAATWHHDIGRLITQA
jgi:hypothetical protein